MGAGRGKKGGPKALFIGALWRFVGFRVLSSVLRFRV